VCTDATVMSLQLQFKTELETGRRTPAFEANSRVSPPIDL
jgi:hypothetical protein